MKTISFLIPYKNSCVRRNNLLLWNLKRLNWLKMMFNNIEICIGEHSVDGQLFNRSLAINKAANEAKGDYFFILDGDCFFSIELFKEIMMKMEEYPWMIPHSGMFRLDKEMSNMILLDYKFEVTNDVREAPGIFVASCSGLNVVSRENFEKIGGFDENFWGWGYEDVAFMITCNTLLGEACRCNKQIYHLWHPEGSTTVERNPEFQKGEQLLQRYIAASWNAWEVKQVKGLK